MRFHLGDCNVVNRDVVREKACRRLSTVAGPEVLNWAEQGINSFHQTLDDLRREGGAVALSEARSALSMLSGALDALEARLRA